MSSWKEVKPAEHRRPLLPYEKALVEFTRKDKFGGIEWYTLFLTAHLDAGIDEARLRAAWVALRHQMPEVAAERDDTEVVYRVPSSADLDAWLKATLTVVDDASAQPAAFSTTLEPAARVELYYFPHRAAVALRSSHWRYDFDGLLMTLDALLDLLASPSPQPPPPAWGPEAARLRTPFFACLDLPEQSPEDAKAYIGQMYAKAFGSGPSAGLPPAGDLATPPGRTAVVQSSLAADRTQALAQACKAAGYTVSSAYHAALLRAIYDHAPAAHRARPQVTMVARAARRLARTAWPDPSLAGPAHAVNSTTILDWKVLGSHDSSFKELADALIDAYRNSFDGNLFLRSTREIENYFGAVVNAPLPADFEPPSNPSLSSLGSLEDLQLMKQSYGAGVQVKDVALQVELPVRQPGLWIYSFRGKFHSVLAYNEAFFGKEYMEGFQRKIYTILEDGLGVSLGARFAQ